ncbi:1-cys peroxiredoxin [Moniliophthora roreri]|nr:1-cys peroxiredoxin [Moniliophthora roreri]
MNKDEIILVSILSGVVVELHNHWCRYAPSPSVAKPVYVRGIETTIEVYSLQHIKFKSRDQKRIQQTGSRSEQGH